MLLCALEFETHADGHGTAQLMMMLLNLLSLNLLETLVLRTILGVSHSVSGHELSQPKVLKLWQMYWREEGISR